VLLTILLGIVLYLLFFYVAHEGQASAILAAGIISLTITGFFSWLIIIDRYLPAIKKTRRHIRRAMESIKENN
jgi:uncharacterized membrane protein